MLTMWLINFILNILARKTNCDSNKNVSNFKSTIFCALKIFYVCYHLFFPLIFFFLHLPINSVSFQRISVWERKKNETKININYGILCIFMEKSAWYLFYIYMHMTGFAFIYVYYAFILVLLTRLYYVYPIFILWIFFLHGK